MDDIREKVRVFLAENKSPDNKDIKDFLDKLAEINPSLDIGDFKKNLTKLIKQAGEIDSYEEKLSSIDSDSPSYKELHNVIKEAKKGHNNFEDVSEDLKNAKHILASLKTKKTREKETPEKELITDLPGSEEETESAKHGAEAVIGEKPAEPEEAAGEGNAGENSEEETAEKETGEEVTQEEGTDEEVVAEKTHAGKKPKKGEKTEAKKSKKSKTSGREKAGTDSVESLMHRLEEDETSAKDLIKEQFTPDKLALIEHLEDKLITDTDARIKQLKETKLISAELKQPTSLFGKLKAFLTSEAEGIETYHQALHGPLVTFEGLEGYQEIERYWVFEPYCFVVILVNPDTNDKLYYAVEPTLSDFEDVLLKELKDRLKDILLVENIKSDEDKDKILTAKVTDIIKDYGIEIEPTTLEKILYYTRRDFIYLDKIDPLIHDDRIEDISSNGHDIPIYLYHKKYTNIPTNIVFNEDEVNSFVIRLAQRCGKHISVAEPLIDATMPDGSRIQMTLGKEVTSHGATFTIRKFSEVPITPVDLINWNTFSAEEMAYLWLCIENNKSLIFAGGTASGKTSSLNAVALFIPQLAKIVSLEDTRELKLPQPNWIPGITRDSFTPDGRGSIDMYELLKAALRQRPEYLLVGEVRGKEALTLFQAMSTGHTTFSTMHADSVSSAIHRLENPPISVPRTMIQALDIISIQSQTYTKDKRVRRNMKLVEITDIDPTTRNIRTNDIFSWDAITDKFIRVGESKALNDIMVRRGWNIQDLKRDLIYRQKILQFMVDNKISDFHAIFTLIHDYHSTPEKVIKQLNLNE
ncbi:MAG: type II/IV secretion system ATPase subunit [Candidatus Methanoperedens sp.]|jgi:flagellar protein FlaI|nr:type II/IV secretion system ATPase subunit [Candidatus Methanoperedens sp.]PKL54315.1 MAG: secretion system protein [Candidatus Methanoperedenaceae archaeon HGW-Methanoperedenaceae-1]